MTNVMSYDDKYGKKKIYILIKKSQKNLKKILRHGEENYVIMEVMCYVSIWYFFKGHSMRKINMYKRVEI
jgi:hypothetical protein